MAAGGPLWCCCPGAFGRGHASMARSGVGNHRLVGICGCPIWAALGWGTAAVVPVLAATTTCPVAWVRFHCCFIVICFPNMFICVACVKWVHTNIYMFMSTKFSSGIEYPRRLSWRPFCLGLHVLRQPLMIELQISYTAEHCILKPMIHCSTTVVVSTQETDTDRCKDAFPIMDCLYCYCAYIMICVSPLVHLRSINYYYYYVQQCCRPPVLFGHHCHPICCHCLTLVRLLSLPKTLFVNWCGSTKIFRSHLKMCSSSKDSLSIVTKSCVR